MKNALIVTKYEFLRYFVSPVAYVYLLSFLILNSSFAIYFGDLFNRGQADLLAMFSYIPWIFLLFIPGISMRLWSEEFRNKTIVQIVTMPISVTALAWGKFLGAWLFAGMAIVLTFPMWITINILGAPDNQVILLGYLACFILSGAMLSLSMIASALTKNQIIALVSAVIINLCFFWSGMEYIQSFCRLFFSDNFIDLIASFSFITHFNVLINGLLELRDVIFFASLIIFCIYTTVLIVNLRTAGTSGLFKSSNVLYSFVGWISLLFIFMGINLIANNLTRNIQYDATKEKIFSLSDSSVNVLKNLPEPVVAKLYFSPILEKRNPALRQHLDIVRILLKKYKDVANGLFDYKIYYPKFLSKEEDIALANGVQPIPIIDLNQNAMFGMTIEDSLQNIQVIPFFAQSSRGQLEQDLTTKIYYLYHKKETIGLISSQILTGTMLDENTIVGEPWAFVEELEQKYDVINISKAEDFEENSFSAVILFHPLDLNDDIVSAIKEYSKKGGKFLVLLDPANEASRLSGITKSALKSSDLGELADFWHLRFYNDYVVADLGNSITVDATVNYDENPAFSQDVIQFKIKKGDMNPKHPITGNLNEIMFASASIVMPEPTAYKEDKIKFYPLLRAGKISELMSSKVVIDGLNPQRILDYFNPDDNQKILAAEVIGMEEDNPFNLIVVGDSDFLYDAFWKGKTNLLNKEYVYSEFDNLNFVLNSLDYLIGDTSLINIRGKSMARRYFDKIEEKRRLNSLKYKKSEGAIFQKIDEAKEALNTIIGKRDFEERENFTSDELAMIANIRKRLDGFRQQLSDLRYLIFVDIDRIVDKIKFFNIWLLPLIFLVIYAVQKLTRLNKNFIIIRIDKKLIKFLSLGIFVLCCGLFSFYVSNRFDIDSYEGKPAFANVLPNINEINQIELATNKASLTFSKPDKEWVLKEMPDLPVYQERIRYLISTIANARFFARKSNKAENLSFFNLLPIEDKNSNVIQVSLKKDDTVIQTFDLGSINIDIGRGAQAAYIRFDKQFQVWEIEADFIDMDLDWHKWTYSNLWDLRYGRLYAPNGDTKTENVLMMLMKMLLNAPIKTIVELKDLPKPLYTYKLFVEGGDYVDLSFYKKDDKAFVSYKFDKNNINSGLVTLAKFLENKVVEIDLEQMEKILEIIKN